ncbi:hypothetical protein KSP40_PGU000595 [Platanthera guangdongensis]|uniref:Uncharacterized protein n=1 Tax=Platanthera guangdongensis TaxID=2320717 RepID=A0ABR2MA42_9ASPA
MGGTHSIHLLLHDSMGQPTQVGADGVELYTDLEACHSSGLIVSRNCGMVAIRSCGQILYWELLHQASPPDKDVSKSFLSRPFAVIESRLNGYHALNGSISAINPSGGTSVSCTDNGTSSNADVIVYGGTHESDFRDIKTIVECLADELINVVKGSSNM